MKKIIALRGKGNSGKTKTIRTLHELLIEKGFEVLTTDIVPIDIRGDFRAVFKYQGKLIGVTSSGDTFDLVIQNLTFLVSFECDVCICACRSFDRYGQGTNAAVNSFDDYEPLFIEKTVEHEETQQPIVNQQDAKKLLHEVMQLIQ
jgi:hypothetical protein